MYRIVSSFFLFIFSVHAMPIGNPASPAILQEGFFVPDTAWSQPRLGYTEDFVHSCNLKSQTAQVKNGWLKSRSELVAITWSILERLNLSVILGTGKNTFHFQFQSNPIHGQVSGGLSWAAEGKLILLEVKDTTLSLFGLGGGYNWMTGKITIDHQIHPQTCSSMKFWQAGASLTQKLGIFFPYIGIVFFQAKWSLSPQNETTFYFEEKHSLGPFLGCSLSSGSQFLLNLEWRVWIENGGSISAEIRF